MIVHLIAEQIALIKSMIRNCLWKADDKMKDRLWKLDSDLATSSGKLTYLHVYQPASDDELKTLKEYLDKGWELVSHTFYNNKEGELMISLIFSRYCDCKNCNKCPYK